MSTFSRSVIVILLVPPNQVHMNQASEAGHKATFRDQPPLPSIATGSDELDLVDILFRDREAEAVRL